MKLHASDCSQFICFLLGKTTSNDFPAQTTGNNDIHKCLRSHNFDWSGFILIKTQHWAVHHQNILNSRMCYSCFEQHPGLKCTAVTDKKGWRQVCTISADAVHLLLLYLFFQLKSVLCPVINTVRYMLHYTVVRCVQALVFVFNSLTFIIRDHFSNECA